MGLLNKLFGTRKELAMEIEKDETAIMQQWQAYINTVSKKKKVHQDVIPDYVEEKSSPTETPPGHGTY